MLWKVCQYPAQYNILINKILVAELDKLGLTNEDCKQDLDWLLSMNAYKLDSMFVKGFLSFRLFCLKPQDIIEHRHKIKQFVKEIHEGKLKHNINTPVNNAVGWKV